MESIVAVARAQLEALDAKRDTLLKIIELAESVDTPAASVVPEGTTKPPVRVRSTATNETWAAVRTILEERGEPVRLRELLAGVCERGINVGGKKPASTLAARLSNSKEFKSYRGVGWWFSKRPLPQRNIEFEGAEGNAHQAQPSAPNQSQGDPYGTALTE